MKKKLFIPLICLTAHQLLLYLLVTQTQLLQRKKTTPSKKQALSPKLRLSQVPMKIYH